MDSLFLNFLQPITLQDVKSDVEVEWRHVSLENNEIQTKDSGLVKLADVQPLLVHTHCVFFIPHMYLYLTQVEINTKNKKQLKKAVPYVLEDDLSEEVEDLHFALANNINESSLGVMVINRNLLSQFISVLREYECEPDIITSDVFNLPWRDTREWVILIQSEYVLARIGEYAGFDCSSSDFLHYLKMSLQNISEDLERINIYQTESGELDNEVLEYLQEINIEVKHCIGSPETFDENAINLLQQEFSPEKNSNIFQSWALPLSFLAVIFSLLMVSNAWEVLRLSKLNDSLNQQIESSFRSAFPDTKNIVNPRIQMEQRLAELKGQEQHKGASFLKLLHSSSLAFADNSDAALTEVRYQSSRLSLSVTASDIQIIDSLKIAMQNQKLNAEVQTIRTTDQQVEAQINIEVLN